MPPARLIVNRFPAALPEGALHQARSLGTPAAALLIEVLEARVAARDEALITLRSASSNGVDLRPLLLPQAQFDPTALQVADWLLRERAA